MELAIDGYSRIIDHNFKEFCSIRKTIDENTMDNFLDVCRKEVSQNILTQFGLSQFFDHFKDGGDVATVHNAKKNIFPSKEVEARYKEVFDRSIYENELPKKRKELFKNQKEVKSYLTGKRLKKDGSTHLDHIVSAKEVHSMDEARLYMTNKDRSAMAQDNRNLKPLESNINQSKNDKNLEEWMNIERKNGKKNKEHFAIDESAGVKQNRKSRKYINNTVRKHKLQTIGSTGINQGINMGKKQVMGLFIYEVIDGFFILSSDLISNWKSTKTIAEKKELFKGTLHDSINIAILKFNNIKDNIIQTFLTGLSSGFLANLITFIINQFATTLKSMVKIINDSIHALIRAFKLLVNRPNNISFETASKEAVKIIGAAMLASGGVIFSESISKFVATTPLAPFANPIGMVLGATLTGLITALMLYTIDNFRDIIHNLGLEISEAIKYTKIKTSEIESLYLKTINDIDELYNKILQTMLKEYKEMADLRKLAYDFNILSSNRFSASIEYTRLLKVEEDEIIKSHKDLENFFFN